MNKIIADFIKLECETDRFTIYTLQQLRLQVDAAAHKRYWSKTVRAPSVDLWEYIYNMPELMAAADLIICRGGASTLSELAAAGKPAIIVPSPNVAGNHQRKRESLEARVRQWLLGKRV
jgi:UDP-N-acetylglucosamine--N-acetylmuramyl-(pentapeptide) pyrophosphoryl-undecaprenol N-acetylglucosamine transferase